MAYAKYYGRSLPSMAQWWRALHVGDAGEGAGEREASEGMHEMMMEDHIGGQPDQETDMGGE
jgi:hypothetical protein